MLLMNPSASVNHFAIALAANHVTFSDNGAAISLTIDEELNLVVPVSAENPAQYIDIALENVRSSHCAPVDVLHGSIEANNHAAAVLFLQLDVSAHANYLQNAVPRHAVEFYITFEDEERAESAAEYIREAQLGRVAPQDETYGRKASSVQKPISVAEIGSQDHAAPEQGMPGLTTPRNVTAVRAQNTQEIGFKRRVSSERRRRSARKVSSSTTPSQTFLKVGSQSQPRPVLETNSSTNDEDTVARMALEEALVCMNGETKEAFTSSDVWRKGQKLIENAPEFKKQLVTTTSPGQTSPDQTRPKQNGRQATMIPDSQPDFSDPDQLYSLSPAGQRVYETKMQTSKLNLESDAPTMGTGQAPLATMNTQPRVDRDQSCDSGDQAAAYKLLGRDFEKVKGKPRSVALPLKSKLKDRLRNKEGLEHVVETDLAMAKSVKFESDKPTKAKLTKRNPLDPNVKETTRAPAAYKKYGKGRTAQIGSDHAEEFAEDEIYDIPKSQDPPPVTQKPQKKVKQGKPIAQPAQTRVAGKSTKSTFAKDPVAAGKTKSLTKSKKPPSSKISPAVKEDISRTADSEDWYDSQIVGDDDNGPPETVPERRSERKAVRAKRPTTNARKSKSKAGAKKLNSITEPRQPPRPTRSAAIKAKKKLANLDEINRVDAEEVDESIDGFAEDGQVTTKPPNPQDPVGDEEPKADSMKQNVHNGDQDRGDQQGSDGKTSIVKGDAEHQQSRLLPEENGSEMAEEPGPEQTHTPGGAAHINPDHRVVSPSRTPGKVLEEGAKAPALQKANETDQSKDRVELLRSSPSPIEGEKVHDSTIKTRTLSDQNTAKPIMFDVPTVPQRPQTPLLQGQSDQPLTEEAGSQTLTTPTLTESAVRPPTAPAAHVKSPVTSREAVIKDEARTQAPNIEGSPNTGPDLAIDQDKPASPKHKRSMADKFKEALAGVEDTLEHSAKKQKALPSSGQRLLTHATSHVSMSPSQGKASLLNAFASSPKTGVSSYAAQPQDLGPLQPHPAPPAEARKSRSSNLPRPERKQIAQDSQELGQTYADRLVQSSNSRRTYLSETVTGTQQANHGIEHELRPSQQALQTQDSEVISVSSAVTGEEEAEPSPSTKPQSRASGKNMTVPKRKANDEAPRAPPKKSKVSPTTAAPRHTVSKLGIDSVVEEWGTLVDDSAIRKTPIISFGKNGPKNQGVPSAKKPSLLRRKDRNRLAATVDHATGKPDLFHPKRKHEETAQAPLLTTPKVKRQRSVTIVPRMVEDAALNATESPSPSGVDLSQKRSSQVARVDEYGSPVPVTSFVEQGTTSTNQLRNAIRISGLEEVQDEFAEGNGNKTRDRVQDKRSEEGLFLHESDHPTSMPGDTPDRGNPEVSTRQRSPDVESEAHPAVTAHRIAPGGRFVNLQTDDVVQVETSLQDPFVRKGSQGSGTFMDKLQAQIPGVKKHAAGGQAMNNGEGSKRTSTRLVREVDPEKTLVSIDDTRDVSQLASENSSTLSSCSSETTKNSALSKGVPEAAPESLREWRVLLRPHQRSTLDVLNEITNVSHSVRPVVLITLLIRRLSATGATSS